MAGTCLGRPERGTSWANNPVCSHALGLMCWPGPQESLAAREGPWVTTAELFGSNSLTLGLRQPTVPRPFSQVRGAGRKGGGTSKGGCGRAPWCSL